MQRETAVPRRQIFSVGRGSFSEEGAPTEDEQVPFEQRRSQRACCTGKSKGRGRRVELEPGRGLVFARPSWSFWE